MVSKVAGQVVQGWIHVNLQSPMFESSGLYLSLKGNERTFMNKGHTKKKNRGKLNRHGRMVTRMRKSRYYRDHTGYMPIIDAQFPVHTAGALLPGMYSFPFTIQLPDWLPASFSIGVDKTRMSVEYSLVAQFIPTSPDYWADDRMTVSSFASQIPLFVMRPMLQNAITLADTVNNLKANVGGCCGLCKTPCNA